MTIESDLFAFYIVTENDDFGETAHGPYTMAEAEARVQVDEKIITRQHLSQLRQQNKTLFADNNNDAAIGSLHEKMLDEIKKWAFFLLVIGVIQIILSESLSNTWGLLLIIVGLSSFYFRSPAMFMVYGTTLGWAAISNALSGSGNWMMFSLLQVYFAFKTFHQFFQFRKNFIALQTEKDTFGLEKTTIPNHATKLFPWISFAFGAVAFVGLVTLFLAVVIFFSITASETYPAFLDFMEGVVIDLAVLGIGTGLAALFSRYPYKLVSILGLIASVVVLVIEVVFIVL